MIISFLLYLLREKGRSFKQTYSEEYTNFLEKGWKLGENI